MVNDSLVLGLIARWKEARERGQHVSVVELCGDRPDLIPVVKEAIRELHGGVDDTTAPPRSSDTASYANTSTAAVLPATVGGMRVVHELGRGGMGWVLEAEDPTLHRRVAVKQMLPELATNPVARERFLREARTQATVEHEHVVAIHAVGEDHGTPYLVMPLLKGESLATRLARAMGAPLPVSEVVRIGREMAEGLVAAHARRLIHRDVKPANVWLEGDAGKVKLLDFGLARLVEVPDDGKITHSGTVLGTPAYMAPEQAAGDSVDARADLFSLGCVLYEMATGMKPFRGSSVFAILTALATEHPKPVREVNPRVPEPLAGLIHSLLVKNPDQRAPATAAGVAKSLSAMGALDDWENAHQSLPTLSAVRDPRRWPLTIGLATVIALISSLGIWLVVRPMTGNTTDTARSIVAESNKPVAPDEQNPDLVNGIARKSDGPAEARLDIDELPTLEIVYTKPPKPAFALIADPGAAAGAVLFLIDRSASMKWTNQGKQLDPSKTSKAMSGLQQIIDAMPRNTTVAVAGYHGANGNKVNLVVKPTKLDGAERSWEQLKMEDKLADLEAVPNGASSLAFSVQQVLDLVAGRAFWPDSGEGRTLVILTDGEDNQAPEEKAEQIIQDSLPDDVKLHMVFFDMSRAEERAARIQFLSLTNPLTDAKARKLPVSLHLGLKTGKDFAEALVGAFRPRLWYASIDSTERGLLSATILGANQGGINIADPSTPLSGSTYEWRCGERMGKLHLVPGDRLLLHAQSVNGQTNLCAPPTAYLLATDPKWNGRTTFAAEGPADDNGAKVYLTIPGVNRSLGVINSKSLMLTATLERATDGKELRQSRPLFPWFEVSGAGDHPRMRVESRWGITAPAWDVTLYDVEQNKKEVFRTKGVAGHWIDDEVLKAVKPARQFNRNVATLTTRLASADGIDIRLLRDGNDVFLTVGLKLENPDELLYMWAKNWIGSRPPERHRYYSKKGQYTVQFGPLTEMQLKQDVGFDVYPVRELQSQAGDRNRAVKLVFGSDEKFAPVEPTGLSVMEPKQIGK